MWKLEQLIANNYELNQRKHSTIIDFPAHANSAKSFFVHTKNINQFEFHSITAIILAASVTLWRMKIVLVVDGATRRINPLMNIIYLLQEATFAGIDFPAFYELFLFHFHFQGWWNDIWDICGRNFAWTFHYELLTSTKPEKVIL